MPIFALQVDADLVISSPLVFKSNPLVHVAGMWYRLIRTGLVAGGVVSSFERVLRMRVIHLRHPSDFHLIRFSSGREYLGVSNGCQVILLREYVEAAPAGPH